MITEDPFESMFEDSTERFDSATRPPSGLALLTAGCAVASAVWFAAAGRTGNWIGYVFGAWAVMFSAIVFRTVDGKRRGRDDYRFNPIWSRLVMGSIATGLVLAATHAWFIAQQTRFAE
jgi:hypothetical protein